MRKTNGNEDKVIQGKKKMLRWLKTNGKAKTWKRILKPKDLRKENKRGSEINIIYIPNVDMTGNDI